MQLTTRLPKRRAHARTKRTPPDSPEGPPALSPPAPEPAALRVPPETRDARRGGGPQDQALYSCVCGFAFKAAVTTSIGCPHCGLEQAW